MSKKVSSVDPISLLREYITGNKPIKLVDDQLSFGSSKLPLNTPTAWNPKVTQKQYSLGDLWLFLDSHLNPSKYPENKYYEEMKKFGLQIVSGYDKEEIIDYFTGKKEDSEAINQELKASIKLNKDKKKPSGNAAPKPKPEGEPALKKKVKTETGEIDAREFKEEGNNQHEETKQSDTQAKEKEYLRVIDYLLRYEKPIDSKNRALRKMGKSFKSVLNYFTDPRASQAEGGQSQAQGQGQMPAPAPKKTNQTRLEDILSSGVGLDQAYPIILVLPVPTAGALSIDNAKEFLEKGTYRDPVKDKKEISSKTKPLITREMQGRKVTFEVMADVESIIKEGYWKRVVAIFITGYTHQFLGWPDGDKVSILFSKKRAYHMKYHDVPLQENIKKWNVKMLEINRNKRFLDTTVKNHFWEDLEAFLLQPPS